jgi:hypothetical protein
LAEAFAMAADRICFLYFQALAMERVKPSRSDQRKHSAFHGPEYVFFRGD